jgi:hypothetical protein
MIKSFHTYNESLRDKMLPKTKEQLKDAFDKVLYHINPKSLNDMGGDDQSDLEDICDLMDSTMESVYFLTDEDRGYNEMFEIFERLVIGKDKKYIMIERQEYEYVIYKDIRMTLGSPDDFNNLNVLIFDWDFLKEKIQDL